MAGRSDRGFTLLEVLIAALIAAMAVAVLFRGTVEGEVIGNVAAKYTEALSRARSRLAAVDAVGSLTAGDQQGDDGGGFRWQVRTTQLAAGRPSASELPPALYAVRVSVSWTTNGRERAVELNTRRLGIAPPRQP